MAPGVKVEYVEAVGLIGEDQVFRQGGPQHEAQVDEIVVGQPEEQGLG